MPDGSVPDGSVPDGSVPDGSVPDGSASGDLATDGIQNLSEVTEIGKVLSERRKLIQR